MVIKINNGKRLFVTSDLHFYHANIIKFQKNRSDRWSYVEDMNAGLIQLWNKKVGPEDSVVIVGDFSFGTPEQTKNIFDQLNGKKYLVFGTQEKNYNTVYLKQSPMSWNSNIMASLSSAHTMHIRSGIRVTTAPIIFTGIPTVHFQMILLRSLWTLE